MKFPCYVVVVIYVSGITYDARAQILPQDIFINDYNGFREIYGVIMEFKRNGIENMISSISQHETRLKNVEHAQQATMDKLKTIQFEVSLLLNHTRKNLEEVGKDVSRLNKTVADGLIEFQKVTVLLASLSTTLTVLKETAITNVRFNHLEGRDIWRGPGFHDTASYLITGVINSNRDDYVDVVHRRKIETFANGTWAGVTFI